MVVFTSSRESRDVNRAFDLGASSYVVKPSGFESLLETVRQVWTYWLITNVPPDARVPAAHAPEKVER